MPTSSRFKGQPDEPIVSGGTLPEVTVSGQSGGSSFFPVSHQEHPEMGSNYDNSALESLWGTGDRMRGDTSWLPFVGSVLDNLFDFGKMYYSDFLARRRDREAYGRSVEQWMRQNAYDDPRAQMARLSRAGLNPNLIYGQMGNGSTASMPSPSSGPSHSPSNIGSGAMQSVQARLAMAREAAEIDLLQAQSEDLRSSVKQREADTGLKGEQAESERFNRVLQRELANSKLKVDEATVTQLSAAAANYMAQASVGRETAYQLHARNQYIYDFIGAELDEIRSRTKLNDNQAKKIWEDWYEEVTEFGYKLRMVQNDAVVSDAEKEARIAQAAVECARAALNKRGYDSILYGPDILDLNKAFWFIVENYLNFNMSGAASAARVIK